MSFPSYGVVFQPTLSDHNDVFMEGVAVTPTMPEKMPVKTLKSARPIEVNAAELSLVRETVATIIADIRENGDAAVRKYSERFDSWTPESFVLSPPEISRIVASVARAVIEDIKFVQAQVRRFAQHQRDSLADFEVETLPGVWLGQKGTSP